MKIFNKKNTKKDETNINENPLNKSSNFKKNKLIKNKIDPSSFEEIKHSTDAINIVMSSSKQNIGSEEDLQNTNALIFKNYDLARRKITTSYNQIIESGSFITTQYLSVQISLYLYEKNLNIDDIHETLNSFISATWEKVSKGISVAYTREIVFEPLIYINKMIPAVTITPSFAQMVNAISYEELFEEMVKKGVMASSNIEIIKTLIESIETNIKLGYYIKLVDIILLKIKIGSTNNMVLFSGETLKRINKTFKKHKTLLNKNNEIVKTNSIAHFKKAKKILEIENEGSDQTKTQVLDKIQVTKVKK